MIKSHARIETRLNEYLKFIGNELISTYKVEYFPGVFLSSIQRFKSPSKYLFYINITYIYYIFKFF